VRYNTETREHVMSEELNDINTVQDLLRIQKTKPATTKEKVEELVHPVFQEAPSLGLEVIDTLVCGLIDLHETMIDEMVDHNEEQDKINAWAVDLSKLHVVQELLDSVKL
jgi:hypothetical protein